jgi:hypothetical protein
MLQLIGQCGPLVGTRLYPDSDAPMYVRGMSVCAGAMVFVALLSLILRLHLQRKNEKNRVSSYEVDDEAQVSLVGKQNSSSNTVLFQYML